MESDGNTWQRQQNITQDIAQACQQLAVPSQAALPYHRIRLVNQEQLIKADQVSSVMVELIMWFGTQWFLLRLIHPIGKGEIPALGLWE